MEPVAETTVPMKTGLRDLLYFSRLRILESHTPNKNMYQLYYFLYKN
jgi:hypothetical protein